MFEWRESDEDIWREADPAPPSPRSPRWRWLMLLMGVAVIAGIFLYTFLNRQVRTVNTQLETELHRTHQLLLAAIWEEDVELYDSLLSPTNDDFWRQNHLNLVQNRALFDRTTYGIMWADPTPTIISSTISSDLRTAELVFDLTYTSDFGDTFPLRHHIRYRANGSGWQQIAFPSNWTGKPTPQQRQYLAIQGNASDKKPTSRLATDLNQMIIGYCAETIVLNRNCFVPQPVISLDYDAQGLNAGMSQIENRPFSIHLPAPLSFGQPTDDMGYNSLLRSYARTFFYTLLITQNTNAKTPPTSATMEQITTNYHLGTAQSVIEKMGLLPPLESKAASLPRPIFPHNQSIHLLCQAGDNGALLTQFNPATSQWDFPQFSDPTYFALNPLADNDSFLLTEAENAGINPNNPLLYTLWQNGQLTPISIKNNQDGYYLFSPSNDPTGQYLNTFLVQTEANRERYGYLDTQNCRANSCPIQPLPSFPHWSPDTTHLLYATATSTYGSLQLADTQGNLLREITSAIQPIWLDNKQFAYFDPSPLLTNLDSLDSFGIFLGNVDDATTRLLLTAFDVRERLPNQDIQDVSMQFADPSRILLEIVTRYFDGNNNAYIASSYLWLNVADGSLTRAGSYEQTGKTALSPNGDFVAFYMPQPNTVYHQVGMLNLTSGEIDAYVLPQKVVPDAPDTSQWHWSADGEWLLVVNAGILQLIHPASNYHQTIVPDLPHCIDGAWGSKVDNVAQLIE